MMMFIFTLTIMLKAQYYYLQLLLKPKIIDYNNLIVIYTDWRAAI